MLLAHDRDQFVVDDLDQRLARRQAANHFLAQRLVAYGVDELLDHRQRDVGFEQRHAHFAQTVANIVFAETALPAQVLQRLR